MPKYTEEIKTQCVESVKAGKSLADVSREFGPNPKAIQRYCAKAGFEIPKKEKKPKAEKADKATDPVKE